MPDPLAGHVMDQRRHRRQGFPRSAASRAIDVGQVVVHPDGIEDAVAADPRPGGIEGRPVDRLRRGLDPDRDLSGAGPHPRAGAAASRAPVVTAPSDAEPTSAAYLAMTPPG